MFFILNHLVFTLSLYPKSLSCDKSVLYPDLNLRVFPERKLGVVNWQQHICDYYNLQDIRNRP